MAIFLKIIFFAVLTIYLVGLGFLLPAINDELNVDNKINYTTIDKQFSVSSSDNLDCDCGTITCNEYIFIHGELPSDCTSASAEKMTIVSTIKDLPIWFNAIFILLPFIMWVTVGVLMFLPV